jgi:hypothetical protein
MQFQIVAQRELDGVEASVPSIRECSAWARTEDEALDLLLERVAYFLNLPPRFKHSLDRSRVEAGATYYTLVLRD